MLADGAFCARVRAAYEGTTGAPAAPTAGHGHGDGDATGATDSAAAVTSTAAAGSSTGSGSGGSNSRAGVVDASTRPSDVKPPTQGRGSSLF